MEEKEIEYDKCVLCEEDTKEPKDRHIDFRNFYVEGSGQLCSNCWVEIYFD